MRSLVLSVAGFVGAMLVGGCSSSDATTSSPADAGTAAEAGGPSDAGAPADSGSATTTDGLETRAGLAVGTAGWAAAEALKSAHAKWKPDATLYDVSSLDVIDGKVSKTGAWLVSFASVSDPDNVFQVQAKGDGSVVDGTPFGVTARSKYSPGYKTSPNDVMKGWVLDSPDAFTKANVPTGTSAFFYARFAKGARDVLPPGSVAASYSDDYPVVVVVNKAPFVFDGRTGETAKTD